MKNNLFKLFILSLLYSCASTSDPNDPLKNTKKVVAAGHKSLYYNGAFEVKGTSIKLIPAFADGEVFLAGQNFQFAKQSFSLNVKKAQESVVILKEGKKLSFEIGDKISKEGKELADKLSAQTNDVGVVIIKKSLADSYGLIAKSPTQFSETHEAVIKESNKIRERMDKFSEQLSESDFPASGRPEFSEKAKEYKTEFSKDVDSFVIGYISWNDYLAKSLAESKEKVNQEDELSKISAKLTNFISTSNDALTSTLKEIKYDFGKGTSEEFKKAEKDIENVYDKGDWLPFAVMKAITRVTKGVLYDGALKPFAEFGVVSVGYVGVNSLWPIALTGSGSVKVARVFVEVFKIGTEGIVYLIAPSAKLALAGLITGGKFIGVAAYYSADESIRASANASLFVASKTVKGSGIITQGAGTYVLAPIAGSAAFTGTNLFGAGVAVAGTTTGGSIALATESSSLAVQGSTKAADYTISGVGTGVAAGAGLGYGAYYVSKALGVPAGITLKGGVVLSYEMTAQLSAQSILAVSDFSYLVLSMEGGKWVVYAVKDTSGKAKSLFTGSVVDLEQVKKEGNEIKKVPATDEEIEKMLDKSKHE